MSVFERYAHYYDSLYQEKDYLAEVRYINDLITKWANRAQSILDIGCGTGQHAALLAQSGKFVHGVDQSEEMIKVALKRKMNTLLCNGGQLEFTCSDIQTMGFKKTYDVITALFHVMNYQENVGAFITAMHTIKAHLQPGGIFIFDSWYGPAVENFEPELRVKRFEDETNKIIRIAEPDYFKQEQRVDVNYQMLVLNKIGGLYQEFVECHKIRYFFMSDIEDMLSEAGFKIIFSEEWLTGESPSIETWSVTIVAQLVGTGT